MNRSILNCCKIVFNSKNKPIIDVVPRFFTTLEVTSCAFRKLDHIKKDYLQIPRRNFRTSSLLCAKDYYKILAVSKNSSTRDIKKSYYDLAKKYHPDANKNDPSAARKFQEISEAYEILGDAEKKREYDSFGSAGQNMGDNPFGGAHRGQWSHQTNMDPEEFFRSIFGDFSKRGFEQGDDAFGFESTYSDSNFGFGATTEVPLKVSFTESVRGAKKYIDLNIIDTCQQCRGSGALFGAKPSKCQVCNGSGMETVTTGPFLMKQTCRNCRGRGHYNRNPCRECGGKGRTVQRKTVSVPVPAGVENGQSLRMSVGNQEIFVKIQVQKSNYFKREGVDVHTDVLVSMCQAVLGGTTRIRGVYGDVDMKIPAGTHSHTRIRLPGKGIKRVHSNGQGDHFCHVKIAIPTYLSEKEKDLISAFAEMESDTPGIIDGFTSTKDGHASKQETENLKKYRSIIDGSFDDKIQKVINKDIESEEKQPTDDKDIASEEKQPTDDKDIASEEKQTTDDKDIASEEKQPTDDKKRESSC